MGSPSRAAPSPALRAEQEQESLRALPRDVLVPIKIQQGSDWPDNSGS